MSKILNFYSVKGGTGKSSLSLLSAKFLSMRGLKTLVLDLDPQRSLSKSFGLSNEEKNVYSWVMGDTSLSESVIQVEPNLSLVSGSIKLLKTQESMNQNFLKEELELVDFDFVLIDNQPTWNSIVRAGIFASDKVIIPSLISTFDLEEIQFVIYEARRIKKDLEIKVVLNRVHSPDKLTTEEEDYINNFTDLEGFLLSSRIPNSTLIRKAIDRNESLEGKSKAKLNSSLRNFLEEVTSHQFQPELFTVRQ